HSGLFLTFGETRLLYIQAMAWFQRIASITDEVGLLDGYPRRRNQASLTNFTGEPHSGRGPGLRRETKVHSAREVCGAQLSARRELDGRSQTRRGYRGLPD